MPFRFPCATLLGVAQRVGGNAEMIGNILDVLATEEEVLDFFGWDILALEC